MPTTLPVRSDDSPFGRKRGIPRGAALLLLWAATMVAFTLPVRPAYTAFSDANFAVLP